MGREIKDKPYGMIPFFIPHAGCPHICVFCNQCRIAGTGRAVLPSPESIGAMITDYIGSNRHSKHWEVAFYGGSFSAIPREQQLALLAPATKAWEEGQIDGIRCSTRPDALSQEEIDFLYDQGVRTVELGVQSLADEVLTAAKRGHTAAQVGEAVQRLRRKGITVGLQFMPGLPGDTVQTILATAVAAARLAPDFARIYPVLVIADTELADMYRAGSYEPLTTEQAVEYCAMMKDILESHHIRVIRTGLQATEDFDQGDGLIAGPYEPAFGELVVSRQLRRQMEEIIAEHEQAFGNTGRGRNTGSKSAVLTGSSKLTNQTSYEVTYPRQWTSKVRGVKNCNKVYMENHYEGSWSWRESGEVSGVVLRINGVPYALKRIE